ncbi:2-phospho-L-lactate transferase [Aromatoleum toluclasticum]|uniref:2-phospho-L-lactate transferase n=1 Tax=Aromatoleum toluclasticum TaxID=92003 RepID=UPI001D184761|nr:2-phospho-L-lactate transferase [Aromatoleum toluclasticum]MCC4114858.1 2-phospho-L-lactate transferase [Aromatoleum toluclasticum]
MKREILALSGGVGGAKLALGLADELRPGELTIVANTGDDFEHLGLSISPDLDTVMYTLAGIGNAEQGWGLAGESWATMDALGRYGAETWFRLGDRDIATHLVRSQRLRAGESLSQVTRRLCRALGVAHTLLPMSDDPVRTMVQTEAGELPFQDYFVRRRCEPRVAGFRFDGIDVARPHPQLLESLRSPTLGATVICPSNPFVSVAPMLRLPGVEAALRASAAPVIAVSPIIAGAAVKGPAAKMMQELNLPQTAEAVAAHYGELIDGFVIDDADVAQAPAIRALGIKVLVVPTLMRNRQDKVGLARRVLAFARALREEEEAPCMP